MGKLLITSLLTLVYLNCFSQIGFETGYFIDNEGNKIDCLIRNVGWENNPSKIRYKLTEQSPTDTANVNQIKEFSIYNESKYVRYNVEIDKSPDDTNNLSNNRRPNFERKTLFLKVLIEGDASLYSYKEKKLGQRFFFKKANSTIEQLVCKKYRVYDKSGGWSIAENNFFKQQLLNDLKCPQLKESQIKSVPYERKGLMKLFIEYNQCIGSDYNEVEPKKRKTTQFLNLSIRPGLSISSLEVDNLTSDRIDLDFGSKTNFRMGAEIEFLLPFNKNKWAFIIEPNYNYFKASTENNVQEATANYQQIDIHVGLRHYFFINDKAKVFINGFVIAPSISLDSKIQFELTGNLNKETAIGNGFATGLGFNYSRLSLEFRYEKSNDILMQFTEWESRYNRSSLILGYKIF